MGIRKVFVAAACGVGVVGMVLGAGEAQAAPSFDGAVYATCHTLDEMPTVGGVDGSVQGMVEQGFTMGQIGRVLAVAANADCTEHYAVIHLWIDIANAKVRAGR